MFPYRDENPTLGQPIMTTLLIAANVVVWLLVQGMGAEPALSQSVCELGLVPGELLQRLPSGYVIPMGHGLGCRMEGQSNWFTLLSSMFLHGSWFHLLGNMWFLWLFGNNVEDSMGSLRYLVFYLISGFAAAAAQILTDPSSPVPMVGASGAISGVMGAYIVLYPRVRVHVLVFLGIFITRIVLPAFVMLGFWLALQLLGGLPSLGGGEGGVAFWAHVGGFAAGAVLISLFRDSDRVAEHRALARTM